MKYIISLYILCLLTSITYSRNDTLYFCEEYRLGKEIGNNDAFYISKNGGSITVMIWARKAINYNKLRLTVQKVWDDNNLELMSDEIWDIEADWYYIFLEDVHFTEEGLYLVTALKPDGTVIASNYVKMFYK